MMRRAFLLLALLLGASACSGLTTSTPVVDSPVPVPATTERTGSASATASPEAPTLAVASETVTPSQVPPTPSLTATMTVALPTLALPTATVTGIPQPEAQSAAIQFYAPGPMSAVLSPARFYGYAVPGYNHKGLMELFGEDGSVLNSALLQLNTDYQWAFFNWSLAFEARGAGELGRLSLSTRDRYGRVTAVQSLHLLLQSAGTELLTPADSLAERCVVDAPLAGQRVTGGVVAVAGEMRPFNSLPLIVELVGRDGGVLGSQLAILPAATSGEYVEFEAEIAYAVGGATPVMLVVRQPDERIAGTMYLFSREIVLYP